MTTAGLLAALALGGAAYVGAAPRRGLARIADRGRVAGGASRARTAGRRAGLAGSGARAVAAALAALGVVGLVGGPVGVLLGAGAGAGAYVLLGRLEPRSVVERRERLAADVPVVAQLMAMAVAAGAPPLIALDVACDAVGGPVADELGIVAAHLRLGAPADRAWAAIDMTGPLGPLGRAVRRSLATGAPLAAALDRLAGDVRERRRHEVDRRARAIGVRAAGPLGLCFLPAFLLVGVVPVVVGVAQHVLAPVL